MRVVREQVEPAGRELGGGAAQRERPRRREVERGEPRRGERRHGGRRRAASRSPVRGAAGRRARDQPALDLDRALELDQLLADRGEERLPRQRRAAEAQVRGARGPRGRSPGRRGRRRGTGAGRRRRPVAKRIRRIPHIASGSDAARAPKITRPRAGWITATWTGAPSRCSSRWSRRAPAPGQAVRRSAAEPERPGRGDLDAELVLHRRAAGQSRRTRCTSTRKEFEPTISPSAPLPFLRRRRETRERRRATTATVAAPATKPVAASAAAWTAGTCAARTGSGTGAGVGRDGEAVDDLPLLGLGLVVWFGAHQPSSMTCAGDGFNAKAAPAGSRTRDPSTAR